MNRLAFALVAFGVIFATALPSFAQRARLSPHDTISSVIGGDRVMLVYGRPYTKNPRTQEVRKIWGELVPFGKIWRTGADEATLIVIQQPIVLAGSAIPAGCFSVWTLPNEDGTAKLIINKQIGQWGVDPRDPKNVYDEANDVARVDLKKADLTDSVDQFTMSVDKDPDVKGGGLITLKWEKTEYSVAFTVGK